MFKGGNWKQGTTACPDPVNDYVINVSIAWASPLEAGAQNRIEISTRIIECFEIENWNEYNDQPCDVMMPQQYQSFKVFTSNDKWCSNKTVKNGCVSGVLFTQCFRCQSTKKRSNSFNDCSSQRWNLKMKREGKKKTRHENRPRLFTIKFITEFVEVIYLKISWAVFECFALVSLS